MYAIQNFTLQWWSDEFIFGKFIAGSFRVSLFFISNIFEDSPGSTIVTLLRNCDTHEM